MRLPPLIIIPKVRQIALSTTAHISWVRQAKKENDKNMCRHKHDLRYRTAKCIFCKRHIHNISFRNYSRRLQY